MKEVTNYLDSAASQRGSNQEVRGEKLLKDVSKSGPLMTILNWVLDKLNLTLVPNLSNSEFLVALGELLYPAGITPAELESLRIRLGDLAYNRSKLAKQLFAEKINELQRRPNFNEKEPDSFLILGNRSWQKVSKTDWNMRAASLILNRPADQRAPASRPPTHFVHSGHYAVSAIASLYKGGKYVENFLTNITSQTIFDQSELIIIDANSPDKESESIAEFQRYYPNILYKRMNYQIGIYEAWNLGIGLAKGRYITNTNLDDLRSPDSFELQVSALERHSFVDVVYQDFLYAIEAQLSYQDAARIGFKSELPIVTANNMLIFNSPHNAPMWRKRLHEEVGLFDTTFKSAGDYEFWLRCLTHKKTFFKINDPHVVYFQNPEGISTKPNTVGFMECQRIQKKYRPQLMSDYLKMSYRDFMDSLGGSRSFLKKKRYYDEVQRKLLQLKR